jgi:hypothetical protein
VHRTCYGKQGRKGGRRTEKETNESEEENGRNEKKRQRKKETKRGTNDSGRIFVLPVYKFVYHVAQVRTYSTRSKLT